MAAVVSSTAILMMLRMTVTTPVTAVVSPMMLPMMMMVVMVVVMVLVMVMAALMMGPAVRVRTIAPRIDGARVCCVAGGTRVRPRAEVIYRTGSPCRPLLQIQWD